MRTIGIIGALEEEIIFLKENIDEMRENRHASMNFYIGLINGCNVVVASSGIGKVNAAICMQILNDCYNVGVVINIGIAGSLNSDINIGDIVLSVDAVQHDIDVSGVGCPLGVIPKMITSVFIADENLRRYARSCYNKVCLDLNIHEGRVASGDQFISDQRKKQAIYNYFKADCTDMEGAAVAQAAFLNNVPFLIIKVISDRADNKANSDYKKYNINASEYFMKIIFELLEYIRKEVKK